MENLFARTSVSLGLRGPVTVIRIIGTLKAPV
jgi:hypothetical protein